MGRGRRWSAWGSHQVSTEWVAAMHLLDEHAAPVLFCTRPAPCEIQQLSRVPLPCPALPAADWIIVSFVMVVGLACAQRGFANS